MVKLYVLITQVTQLTGYVCTPNDPTVSITLDGRLPGINANQQLGPGGSNCDSLKLEDEERVSDR